MSLNLEKFFPVVPLVGTLVAISFDVGYFYGVGINYFTFFSLTEHVLFSFEALPYALLMLPFCLFAFALADRPLKSADKEVTRIEGLTLEEIGKRLEMLRAELATLKRSRLIRRALLLAATILYVAYLWHQEYYRLAIWITVFDAMLTLRWINKTGWYAEDITALLVSCVVGTLLLGEHFGTSFVTKAATQDTLFLKSGDQVEANIIRAGERGVLLSLPSKTTVNFLPWEDIKSVSQQRSPSVFSR